MKQSMLPEVAPPEPNSSLTGCAWPPGTQLRERVQSSAQNSLGSHFASLDVNKDGVLQPAEFKRALSELNLGHDVNDYVFANLLKAGAPPSIPTSLASVSRHRRGKTVCYRCRYNAVKPG